MNRLKTLNVEDRPAPIDNICLIDFSTKLKLRANLEYNKDFVVLRKETWKAIHSWYGGGPGIHRKVIVRKTKPVLELYPPLVNVKV